MSMLSRSHNIWTFFSCMKQRGETPLHKLLAPGRILILDVFKLLLDCGADLDLTDAVRQSFLMNQVGY